MGQSMRHAKIVMCLLYETILFHPNKGVKICMLPEDQNNMAKLYYDMVLNRIIIPFTPSEFEMHKVTSFLIGVKGGFIGECTNFVLKAFKKKH